MRNPKQAEGRVGPVPALAATAFIAAMAASLWWQTREEPAEPAIAQAQSPATPPTAPATAPTPAVAGAVRAFLDFAERPAPEELPLDHGYTAEGLRTMAQALARTGGSVLWRDRARRLEDAAARLEEDPSSLSHADIARAAFTEAADWLEDERVMRAAESIRADAPLREQKDEVARFFDAVAASLHGASAS